MAARPASGTRPVILILSWIPAATTALLYFFLGPFYAAHLLLAATLMVIVSALILPAHRIPLRQVGSRKAPESASLT
jgi:hypothetical protein